MVATGDLFFIAIDFSMGSYDNPIDGKLYICPSLADFQNPNRKVRIITKAIESSESYAFAKIKEELVLRHHDGAKTTITAKLFEDNRRIFVLSIQGYTVATEKPHNASFSFIGKEIDELIAFINKTQTINLQNPSFMKISDEELDKMTFTEEQTKKILFKNPSL